MRLNSILVYIVVEDGRIKNATFEKENSKLIKKNSPVVVLLLYTS